MNIKILCGIIKPVAALSMALVTCASLSAQTIDTPETPTVPFQPEIQSYQLQQGHATSVSMMKYEHLQTSQELCSCYLTAEDTVDVHFKLSDFSYERGLGDSFPAGESRILLGLYRVAGSTQSLVLNLPFRVDGSSMQTFISERYERQDSVVLSLSPGRYMLKYGGFSDVPELEPDEPVIDGIGEVITEEEDGGLTIHPRSGSSAEGRPSNSMVSLTLECMPLIEDSREVHSWNRVVMMTSRDGTLSSVMESVKWLDDFGREESLHQLGISPSGKTIVSLTEYDGHGRLSRKWLPAGMDTERVIRPGHLVRYVDRHAGAAEIAELATAANGGDGAPFSETVYDGSPLDRPSVEYGPGTAWRLAERSVSTEYLSNMAENPRLNCLMFSAVCDLNETTVTVFQTGSYPDHCLRVTSVTDEDGMESLDFTDRLGRRILARQVVVEGGETRYFDTYYIYDGLDHLLAVLPPSLSAQFESSQFPGQSEVDRYAYLYLYDGKERLCAKKLPGNGWVRMAYDDADRLVLMQDAVQRASGKSMFFLYDVHGRECVTGLCDRDIQTGEMLSGVVCAAYEGSLGMMGGYGCTGLSIVSPQVMSVNFYDNYDFVEDFATGLQDCPSLYGYPIPLTVGRQTGSCQHVLSEEIGMDAVWRLIRYDNRGRNAHEETSYPDGRWISEDVEYNFLGNPVRRHIIHG